MAFHEPSHWHFAGILMTIFYTTFLCRVGRSAPLWQIVTALPGTLMHELSHLVVAFITGGHPSGFSIIPHPRECRRSDGTLTTAWTLGSVTMSRAWFLSAFPTGMAPLLLNVAAWYLYCYWFEWFPDDLGHTLGLYLSIATLSSGSIPSAQDFKVALSSPVGVLFYLLLMYSGFCFREYMIT